MGCRELLRHPLRTRESLQNAGRRKRADKRRCSRARRAHKTGPWAWLESAALGRAPPRLGEGKLVWSSFIDSQAAPGGPPRPPLTWPAGRAHDRSDTGRAVASRRCGYSPSSS